MSAHQGFATILWFGVRNVKTCQKVKKVRKVQDVKSGNGNSKDVYNFVVVVNSWSKFFFELLFSSRNPLLGRLSI